MANSQLAAAARWYARRGLRVFPIAPGRKTPRVSDNLAVATTDPAPITGWWDRWPTANIGIATGAGSGIFVFDVDPQHGGDATLADLTRRYGPLPDTWRLLTPHGGHHDYFRNDGTVGSLQNLGRSRDIPITGIDVKGTGGYVVSAPSVLAPTVLEDGTPDPGGAYRWEHGYAPWELQLADAPAWLIDAVRHQDRDRRGRLCRDGTPLRLTKGSRNQYLFRLACADRRYGLCAQAIARCLEIVNDLHCRPPLDSEEITKIAASAERYDPADPFRPFTPFSYTDASSSGGADIDDLIARELGLRS